MTCYQNYLERVALTVWVGGMWVSGFVVAPILFANLDRQLAGNIAGQVFQVISYAGITCLLLLIFLKFFSNRSLIVKDWQFWGLLAALLITLFGEFYLAEAMREIKLSQPLLDKNSQAYGEFSRLHGFSSTLFLVNCLLGLVLVLKYRFSVSHNGQLE